VPYQWLERNIFDHPGRIDHGLGQNGSMMGVEVLQF